MLFANHIVILTEINDEREDALGSRYKMKINKELMSDEVVSRHDT